MRFTIPTITALSLATSVLAAAMNTTQEFYLRTELKTKEIGKDAYDNLYIGICHTGAAHNYAVLGDESRAMKGFANASNTANPSGGVYNYQEFDFGGGPPYGLSVSRFSTYDAWKPVNINVGLGDAGYSFNASGLQLGWGTEAGGWLVCDWAHGVPQLFQRLRYVNLSMVQKVS
ncbi:hypothetical protein BDV97DRAFT_352119 [Delphinella strobiligena]|nr:hypothetical protein BDV97DRAFT_352119 [Delphinella strobiligena]